MPISPSSLSGYEFNSVAEKNIYIAAKESGYFNNSERYFFHSLSMAHTGEKKIKAEIDFVYLDSDCILFFEVKGGQVKFNSFENEWWVLGGTVKGDPFKQAYQSLFQTRDHLLPELFKSKSVPGRLVFGIGVLFPECLKPNEFKKNTSDAMEFDPDLIYDNKDHKLKNGFINFIIHVKKYWSDHPQFKNRSGLSQKEVITISKYFRQDLHFKLPVSDLLIKGENDINRLTGLQMYVLDNLKFNPGKGGIILGGPGTGKTILAIELLRRLLDDEKRTLLVCFNKNLADHLNKQVTSANFRGQFKIHHLHSLYRDSEFIKYDIRSKDENTDYWKRDLPLFFAHNLDDTRKEYFDYIIIDEGQDILNEYHFEALGKLLKGGLDSGNWTIFMDKDFQNIYNEDADEYFDYMRAVYPCFVTKLYLNCRNTVSTIKRASAQTGFPEMPCLRTDENWNSEIKFFSTQLDLKNKINDLVVGMEKEGIERKDISILFTEKAYLNDFILSNPDRYAESAFNVPGRINSSTIHSFKGLENKFIIICGPENYDPNDIKQMALIYIANTRATAQSIFFLNKRFEQIIVNRIVNNT